MRGDEGAVAVYFEAAAVITALVLLGAGSGTSRSKPDQRCHHAGERGFAGNLESPSTEPCHHAQHPSESVFCLYLQHPRGTGCRWRTLSVFRPAPVTHDCGCGDELQFDIGHHEYTAFAQITSLRTAIRPDDGFRAACSFDRMLAVMLGRLRRDASSRSRGSPRWGRCPAGCRVIRFQPVRPY